MDNGPAHVRPYLDQLQRLPFVRSARLAARSKAPVEVDALVVLATPAGDMTLPAELKRSHLSRDVAEHLVSRAARHPGLIVFAPHIGRQLGQLFVEANVNFVDLAGNCHVRLGDQFLAHVQGQPVPTRQPTDRSLRAPAFSVLFALLADPKLSQASTRVLAQAAGGVSPQTATDLRAKLVANGVLLKGKTGLRWAPDGPKQALDMFLFAFPQLIGGFLVGRFRAQATDPAQLESELAKRLDALGPWRFGGGAAAHRLTGYYRGDRTIVYLQDRNATGIERLPLVPDPNGSIALFGALGPLALQGPLVDVVHPLLVYADLIHEGGERARDAASEIFDKYLRGSESNP